MKNILSIFVTDLRRLATNWIALVVAAGIIVLPSLYAWFNIAANWDPYSNTEGIRVAVASQDEGTTLEGTELNIGRMIVEKLAANHQIGWEIKDNADEAMEGVKSGEYYAAILIPADFSEKIASFLTSDIRRPTIEYYVNEKKNAIAPKITDKGVGVVQQEVNKTFISTVTEVAGKALNLTDETLQSGGRSAMDALLSSLEEASGNLDEISVTLGSLESAALSVSDAADLLSLALPDGDALFADGQQAITDAKGVITSSRQLSRLLSSSLDTVSFSASTLVQSSGRELDAALDRLDSGREGAVESLTSAKTASDRALLLCRSLSSALESLHERFPDLQLLSKACDKLASLIQKQQQLSDRLSSAIADLNASGELSAQKRQELKALEADLQSDWQAFDSLLRSQLTPQLTSTMDGVFDTLTDFSGLLSSASRSTSLLAGSADSLKSALSHGVDALRGTQSLIDSAKGRLDQVLEELRGVSEGEAMQKLEALMQNDPSLMASFLSEPVEVESTSLYPIANYGSAMAPFYTILAIWVGGLVLVAILKARVKEEEKYAHFKPYQLYFGRYLLFMLCGILQALIVCLGDLYLLHIQCQNPGLFILAGVCSSVVFTLLIYTLTVSFGDVGKAIAVILLVIQVAGAGGTFPIEVTPDFFKAVNPFLPFTAGINAMRETIAGMYGNHYLLNLLGLFAHIPVALAIGLVLRKPLIRMNEFFERRLEETKLM